MSTVTIDEARLKAIFKKAIVEVLVERKELVTELIEEALEDEGLVCAIKEGEKTRRVSRAQVFKVLGTNQ